MIDFVIKHWLTVLFGLVMTALSVGYQNLSKKIKRGKAESKAVQAGVVALLADRIIQLYNYYAEQGYCPIYARSNAESLYKAYHALGGNGTISTLYMKLLAMPTVKEEKHD